MITYKQWKLLNESFGNFTLGVKSPSNLGLVSQHQTGETGANFDEMGMMPKMPMYMDDEEGSPNGKKKPPFGGGKPPFGGGDDGGMGGPDDMGGDDGGMGDEMGGPDDMGGEDDGMGGEGEMQPCPDCNPEGDGEGDPDCETCGGEGQVPSEEGDDSVDPDAEFDDDPMGDPMGDMGGEGEDDDMGMPMKKKPPMGMPHSGGPFMSFQKRMKAEGCGSDHEDGDDMVKGKGDKGKELAFLQKKNMKKKMSSGDSAAKDTKLGKPGHGGGKSAPKGDGGVKTGSHPNQKYTVGKGMFSKKCASGMEDGKPKMCGKCSKQKKNMKEANQDYGRPKDFDNSDEAFIRSMKSMYGNPHQKFSDGLRDFSEDMLLPAKQPGPGEPGFAPQTRVGSDAGSMSESITHLMHKIAELEAQLKKQK